MDSDGLTPLLMHAARSAAAADGVSVPANQDEGGSNDDAGGGESADINNFNPDSNTNNLANNNDTLSNLQNQILNGNSMINSNVKQENESLMPPNRVTSSGGGVADDEALSESPEPNVSSAAAHPVNGGNMGGGGGGGENTGNRRKAPLRRGKWTPEEEAYANRLIQEFKAGLLPLTDGTTLRTFLSKLLNCDPMRISKKFVGSNCIGKQVFRRRGADVNNLTPDQIQKTRLELSELEKKFLDRVAQNKSKGGGGGGGHSSSNAANRSLQDSKPGSTSGDALLGMAGLSGMNKSAAAAGRALLQDRPNQGQSQNNGMGGMMGGDNNNSGVGLLAQLQASQPSMFDNSAGNFLGANAGKLNANAATSASINNLMLQTGISREQINQLAQTKGLSSSASLANMLGKQRSFDGLMSLDFQSMQSIDNLANLIQAGLPNQVPKGAMNNWDWSNAANNMAGAPSTNANAASFGDQNSRRTPNAASGPSPDAGSLENLVRSLSNSNNQASQGGGAVTNQANANFGNLLQSMQQGNSSASGPSNSNAGINNFLQSIQQQQQQGGNSSLAGQNTNYGDLLQGMGNASGGGATNIEALLKNIQNNNNTHNNNAGNDLSAIQQMQGGRNTGGNDLFNLMGGSGDQNQQHLNPLMQLNDPFGGFQHGGQTNPMMALAQQQLLAQAGGGNQGMGNLFSQQNGLASLGGMSGMGNNFGNLGGNFGGNLGGSNFGGNQNTAALLQQLLAQQQNNGGGGSNGNTPVGNDNNNSAAATFAQQVQQQHQQQQQQQHRQFDFGVQGASGMQQLDGSNAQHLLGNKRDFGDMNGAGDAYDDGGVTKKASL